MGYNSILIFIIILLICYIIYISEQNLCTNGFNTCIKSNNELNFLLNSIDGYWISDDNFNKESEIDKMTLYIDFNSYTADLVMIINNKIIINEKYNFYIDEDNVVKYYDKTNTNSSIKFNISFMSANKSKNTIWNNKQFNCILSPLSGNFQLYDNDNILYGDFIKDYTISNFINNL